LLSTRLLFLRKLVSSPLLGTLGTPLLGTLSFYTEDTGCFIKRSTMSAEQKEAYRKVIRAIASATITFDEVATRCIRLVVFCG
jgi:hypothetical protein